MKEELAALFINELAEEANKLMDDLYKAQKERDIWKDIAFRLIKERLESAYK